MAMRADQGANTGAQRARLDATPPDEQIRPLLHRIWFDMGNGPVPPEERYGDARRSAERMHAHWRIVDWDKDAAERLLNERYPWFLPVWRAYRSEIHRVDAIRYFCIHAYGGVYADQDIMFVRPLDALIAPPRRTVLVCDTPLLGGLNNYFMAGVRGDPFFAHAISRLPRAAQSPWHVKRSAIGTFVVAGPTFLDRAYRSYVRRGDITLLGPEAFGRPARARALAAPRARWRRHAAHPQRADDDENKTEHAAENGAERDGHRAVADSPSLRLLPGGPQRCMRDARLPARADSNSLLSSVRLAEVLHGRDAYPNRARARACADDPALARFGYHRSDKSWGVSDKVMCDALRIGALVVLLALLLVCARWLAGRCSARHLGR